MFWSVNFDFFLLFFAAVKQLVFDVFFARRDPFPKGGSGHNRCAGRP